MAAGGRYNNDGSVKTSSGSSGGGGVDYADPAAIMGLFEALSAPEPRDLGEELGALLQYNPQFQEQQLQANENLYRQNIGLVKEGLAPGGLVDAFAQARGREDWYDLKRLKTYGGQYVDEINSLYDAVPQSEILQILEGQAIDGLNAGMDLTDDEERLVQQASRTAYNDRGMARSNAAIGDELLQTYGMGRQVQDQRRQFALQVDQYGDRKAGSRANAVADTLLARGPSGAGYAAGLVGQQAGNTGLSGYASGLFGQNYEGAFAGYNNEANMLAALYGGQMQMDAAENAASASRNAGLMSGLGSVIGGGLQALAISDARAKEDIARTGTTEGGVPWYSYRYKGDPTRREGVMAQELIDLAPEAVVDLGGVLGVDYAKVI